MEIPQRRLQGMKWATAISPAGQARAQENAGFYRQNQPPPPPFQLASSHGQSATVPMLLLGLYQKRSHFFAFLKDLVLEFAFSHFSGICTKSRIFRQLSQVPILFLCGSTCFGWHSYL